MSRRLKKFIDRAEYAFIALAFAYWAAHLLRAFLKSKGVL